MASAQSARAPRRAPQPQAKPRQRPRVVVGGARGIRWDRISRVALLVVLLVVVLLYVGPARSYLSTVNEAKQRRGAVAQLERENRVLRAQRAALSKPGLLEREARRLGLVRRGERSYAIENLPR